MGPLSRFGPACGGSAEVSAAGAMDPTPLTIGGSRGLPDTRGVDRGMRRRVLNALAGDNGAGRDRFARSLGSEGHHLRGQNKHLCVVAGFSS